MSTGMKFFSLPADFKKSTVDKCYSLNREYSDSRIIEVYGQITFGQSMFASARILEDLNKVDLDFLKEYITYLNTKNIKFSYTLNGTCNGNVEFTEKGLKSLYDFLGQLNNAGVHSITVALPSLLEIVKESGFDFKVKASTLCGINNANKALAYKDKGVSRIVVDEEITRDFKRLREISNAFGDGVEIIVNDTCFTGCPYKVFHFNYMSHCSIDGKEEYSGKSFYLNRCNQQRLGDMKSYLHLNWIRPEDLKYYTQAGIHYFKIQGRQFVQLGDLIKVVEAYMKEDYDGDLLNMLNLFVKYNSFNPKIDNKKLDGFLQRFWDHPEACINNCSICNYCEGWAKKSINYEESQPMDNEAIDYFKNTDEFKTMINKVKTEYTKSKDLFDLDEKLCWRK